MRAHSLQRLENALILKSVELQSWTLFLRYSKGLGALKAIEPLNENRQWLSSNLHLCQSIIGLSTTFR